LDGGDAVNQYYDVVAMSTVVSINAELIDDLECVLAPVFDVDESVIEGRAVVSDKRFAVPKGACCLVYIRRDDLLEEPSKFAVGKSNTIQGFEFFPEVCFKRSSIPNVGTMFILEVP
jgi:hypothetical protein